MSAIVSPSPSILAAICGEAPSKIVQSHGHYLQWFQSQLGEDIELTPWFVQDEHRQPRLEDFDGVLITGSPASLTTPQPWMEVVVETIRQAAETKVPLLGVCFGHQLVGCAYGAPTTKAADEGELGSLAIELNEAGAADPLFKDCPSNFKAQFAHHDQVAPEGIAYSNGLRVLASSANTPVQALAGGDFIRSVQFHPEFNAEIMSSYIAEDGSETATSEDCKFASKVLNNWVDGWIRRN
jgi:GMP synthase (glutamine-hydrolysing)